MLLTRLVQVVLFQLITFHDATRAWRRLVTLPESRHPASPDSDAPGRDPTGGRFHRTLQELGYLLTGDYVGRGARAAHFVESLVNVGTSELIGGLQQIPGVGPWTANYVAGTAHGAADAELLGDFHLPNTLAWILSREQRADDARMLELLEPHRPHRFRIVRSGRRGTRRVEVRVPVMAGAASTGNNRRINVTGLARHDRYDGTTLQRSSTTHRSIEGCELTARDRCAGQQRHADASAVRWQYRGGIPERDRKAFLFTNVVDSREHQYDIPVVIGALAATADVYRIGMDCDLDKIGAKWSNAIANPIPPREVKDAACRIVIRATNCAAKATA